MPYRSSRKLFRSGRQAAGRGPRHARLTEIAQALGVTVSYLVADDGADQGPSSPGLPCVEVPLLANAASMGIGADDHNRGITPRVNEQAAGLFFLPFVVTFACKVQK